jgi:transposase-like protein
MVYEEFPIVEFFSKITTEDQAIEMAWKYKTEAHGYRCPKCPEIGFYHHKKRPEIRECKSCGHQHRVRVDTIFQNSKLSMLIWVRAIYLMMMGKRGISALELQKQLNIKTYRSSLHLLRKVRHALSERDSSYELEGMIELDGAKFGKKATDNQEDVLIAIESRDWTNDKGEQVSKAGFAKVFFGSESKDNAQSFVNRDIKKGSEVHTDAARAYLQGLENVDLKSKGMYGDPKRLTEWLPWVHRFISNAKTWILGTHHGVNSKHFKLYLAEYTYRFNRRHDYKRYFSRALLACMSSGSLKLS